MTLSLSTDGMRSGNLIARTREETALGPRQTLHTASRDLLEQRIDFALDEFVARHSRDSLRGVAAFSEFPLQPRRMPVSKELRVEPAGRESAGNSAVTQRSMTIHHKHNKAHERNRICEMFRLKTKRK